ncbi:Membrane insertase [Parasponia andersonii]|uniref:Membrane insertase n=1 Tax=Parasponia andersonii TaxID=3476 RepID=A0A2P5B9M2_PARAD|nr:Membrane insertase [Parasponia andersonii]
MSLDHHPGFDCGGALWFQNLTELPHGILGSIFPVVIAGLHYINVQISFRRSSLKEATGPLDITVKYFKHYLDYFTLAILLTCYCVPQGALVYWVTNSSLTTIQLNVLMSKFFDIMHCMITLQSLTLKHPAVRAKLELPDKKSPTSDADSGVSSPAVTPLSEPKNLHHVSLKDLSPIELLNLSVQLLSKRQIERAIPIIQLALTKDPESTRGLILMGQTLMQKGMLTEAIEYLERAISKILITGHPTEVVEIDDLILASQWAGSLHIRQGNFKEGLIHLERIGKLKEPDHSVSKARYFDGLLLLSSALYNVGRREEAANYLRLAVAYNPAFNEYLEQCENEDNSLLGDLTKNRRQDH